MKFLENNIGENIEDLGFGDEVLDATLKSWWMKGIAGKLNFFKLKTSAVPRTLLIELKDKYRLGEYICKTHIWYIQTIQRTLKTSIRNNSI